MLVHGDGTGARTLTDELMLWLKDQGFDDSAQELQPVNRLDVETSGIVLFSLNRQTQPLFDALVAGHECRKRYLALVAGAVSRERFEVNQPLARDRHDARRMRVARGGKPSKTSFVRLSSERGRSLLVAELHSGRKHQIRVHLSWAGHPIVGDRLYDGPASKDGLMLHAWKLEFEHPVTGEQIAIETEVPGRFSSFCTRLQARQTS